MNNKYKQQNLNERADTIETIDNKIGEINRLLWDHRKAFSYDDRFCELGRQVDKLLIEIQHLTLPLI